MEADQQAPKKIRTFISIDPPDEWKKALGELQSKFKKAAGDPGIKWVRPASIHITFRFLGYIFPSAVEEIKPLLELVAKQIPSFELLPGTPGCFPDCHRPRVLWVGILDPDGYLENLQSAISKATSTFGEAPDDRPFVPHLTVARVKDLSKSNRESLSGLLPKSKFKAGPWRVARFMLMQSRLSSAGSEYSTLAEFNLG